MLEMTLQFRAAGVASLAFQMYRGCATQEDLRSVGLSAVTKNQESKWKARRKHALIRERAVGSDTKTEEGRFRRPV